MSRSEVDKLQAYLDAMPEDEYEAMMHDRAVKASAQYAVELMDKYLKDPASLAAATTTLKDSELGRMHLG